MTEVDLVYVYAGHVISKEKKTYNSNVRLEVGEPDYKWRSADSKVMEEADEFDAMEGLDEDLDEHDSLNGEYEIKNLTIKTKEEAEKTAIRLLGARLKSLHMKLNYDNASCVICNGDPNIF